jgi:hypothetical protein
MNNQELKRLMVDQIRLEFDLINLLEECFDEIFKERNKSAKYRLLEFINVYGENEYIPGIDYFKKEFIKEDKLDE